MTNNFQFSNLPKLYKLIPKKQFPIKLVWIGLDHVGKSSLIKRLKTGEFFPDPPRTMGLTVDKLFYEADSNFEIIAWDLGGQISFRENLWNDYLIGASAIIYVFDSSTNNKKLISESKQELWKYVLSEKNKISSLPILILANKADNDSIKEKNIFIKELELDKVKQKNIALFIVSALTGLNLEPAFEWLFNELVKDSK